MPASSTPDDLEVAAASVSPTEPDATLPTGASNGTGGPRAGQSGFASPFGRRIAGVFATRIVQFGLSLATSILVSRLLGPVDKGAFVAISTLPGMLAAVGLFGLPAATNYFAGKGSSLASLVRASLVFTAILSVVLVGLVWVALPELEASILRAAPDHMLRVILVTVPLGMLASFGGTILYGRQAVRTYNTILVAQSALALVGAVILVGILRLGVAGAVASNVIVISFLTIAVMWAVRRRQQTDRGGPPASLRAVAGYGARLYPASITGYFNYRADTYIIQALMAAPGLALGLYSMAVTMAELVFYVPDSVSTIFLPRVAGATEEEGQRIVGRVGRLTMTVTLAVAVCLIPVAFLGIHIVLPAYVDSLPAFLVLLPGVVSLSLAKVMTSYVSGRGRPGLVSAGAIAALVANLGFNLVLIPRLGIVGASLSSVVSYTLLAALMLLATSRMSHQSAWSLFVPGRAEVSLLTVTLRRLAGRLSRVRWPGRRVGA